MRRRDVPLGDRDEAGESRLRRQQIVITRIQTVLGDALHDRKELPRRVEEKAKLHGVEYRLRMLGDPSTYSAPWVDHAGKLLAAQSHHLAQRLSLLAATAAFI
jgi:hypothetical protein